MIVGAILTLAAAQAIPIPPPVVQVTADCTHPTYATDMLVCSDPALRALDQRIVVAIADTPADALRSRWIEDQPGWFRRCRLCAFHTDQRACVTAAYQERLAVLDLARSSPGATGSCRLADGRTGSVAELGRAAALSITGSVIAVGRLIDPAWKPFVVYARSGSRATFRSGDGKSVARCRFGTLREL